MPKHSEGRGEYKTATAKRRRQQEAFLEALPKHETTDKTLAALGFGKGSIDRWRYEPDFLRRYNRIKDEIKRKQKLLRDAELIFNPKRRMPPKSDFRTWRPIYTGRQVLPHLEHLVDAWFDHTNLVVICYMPPGSGKDTTAMDLLLYELCDDRSLRACWLMQSEKFSRRRIKNRLEPYLVDPKTYDYTPLGASSIRPTRSLIEDYGPFRWEKGMLYPDGSSIDRPVWNANEMNFLASTAPESEPNLWATGINGELYGARVKMMVLSDPFTMENQRNPKTRGEQMDWVDGTMESRLDDDGRLLVINTRVAAYDNQGRLLRRFTEGARVVKVSDDGFYTKYSNGTATVIIPAIQVNEDGVEVSYWPEQHPLDGMIVLPNGDEILTDDLSDEEIEFLTLNGGKRRRGLREMRRRKPTLFASMWQQQPKTSDQGEFTQELLDHCDDLTRSVGQVRAGEILVQGVDPARTFGASWVMWAWDPKARTATVVDFFFGTKLGTQGIREKLLADPVSRYLPRYVCWEVNTESAVLDHPDVIDILDDTKSQLVRHKTGDNRNAVGVGVASMPRFMRDGTIRFPAASAVDREKMDLFKEHFQNWDENEQATVTLRPGKTGHLADDIAMAGWVGWVQIRSMMKRSLSKARRRAIPGITLRRWGQRLKVAEAKQARLAASENPTKPATDLEAAYHGWHDDT